MRLTALREVSDRYLKVSSQTAIEALNPLDSLRKQQQELERKFWESSPPILLRYQQKWISDRSQIKVAEKSRRVGLSWADAADSALEAAKTKGEDTWYIGFNKEMSEQYIQDVAFWAKAYGLVATAVEEFIFEDEDQDILAFRVRFASGYKVTALSSRPSNLRAKKGRIRIDEAAFHQDLGELLKAAIAIKMWGGSIAIWSTHDGEDNAFNQMIQAIQKGELSYSLHRITLKDAIEDGLYKRICLVMGVQWTLEGEVEWEGQLRADYGLAAQEELDCIPFKAEAGKVFNRTWFEVLDIAPPYSAVVRFWDLAATAQDVAKKEHYYTVGVKLAKAYGFWVVLDVIAEQLGASEVGDLIVKTAHQDGQLVRVRWELEGGSAGRILESILSSAMSGYNAAAVSPMGDKVTRMLPVASIAKPEDGHEYGNLKLLRGGWNDMFINALHKIDGVKRPLISDCGDALSGAYTELNGVGAIVQPSAIAVKRQNSPKNLRKIFGR